MKILERLNEFYPNHPEMERFLLTNTKSIKVRKNEIISTQGSFNRNVYFVEKGLIRSFYIEKGKEITTNFYTEGKLAANTDTLFNQKDSRYSIDALEDSELLYINYLELEEFCENSVTASNFSRFILGKLMTQMAARITDLQYLSAREKYDKLMTEHPDIILRAPLGMIASYLGITQETLSRIRSKSGRTK